MNQQSERYLINKRMVKIFVLKKKRNRFAKAAGVYPLPKAKFRVSSDDKPSLPTTA
ncbi:MAG: hypothetical protein ACXWT4_17575 [Methylobacter sp.]|uniref:hypothetical protein n=1 Tax=Methylobacter sp. TaxID=2051955 RepID=UPI0025EE6D5F|nr:hypothetical protein [Methylobacter sp.]MCK9620465.1 hypothetical protein [Methylobacter sp.]